MAAHGAVLAEDTRTHVKTHAHASTYGDIHARVGSERLTRDVRTREAESDTPSTTRA